ncbi:MAG TPA: SDR family NAD(P)-dependent oxidoreductase, partial [Candidatus Dormibacteraeota bacterium]|nr:SDR family NAD(P)-dependent oxidoreductase [Candidatus Dormibacteraeota bacterium]
MDERSVVITGASTGIGAAAALHLDELGWRVFAGVRREQDGDRLRKEAGDRLTPVRLDVTDAASLTAAASEVEAATGAAGLQGVVCNAGIARAGPIELIDLDELRHQFEVN